ncbi:DUF4349 domain-containing protein [Candidatus Woesearchaeota archaeon]|nr:DUF4349 domain-containing protein [Candidatus Woesearchaeota archaeon]
MELKNQIEKLKENWLLIVLLVVLVMFSGGMNQMLQGGLMSAARYSVAYDSDYGGYGMAESKMYSAYSPTSSYYPGMDFAPEVDERVVIKDTTMSTEVERGKFDSAASTLKSTISNTGSILLNENVNQYGEGWKAYKVGSYQVKVPTTEYDSVLAQLKQIGEVTSFRESARDVTGTYTNLNTELDAEKARLDRYQDMFSEAKEISDKIELNDRIFNQERTIKYLEESIENIDNKVEYSQVYISISEKRSEYVDIAIVKFSQLIMGMVNSFNAMLSLVFVILPWAALLGVFLMIRKVKGKKK